MRSLSMLLALVAGCAAAPAPAPTVVVPAPAPATSATPALVVAADDAATEEHLAVPIRAGDPTLGDRRAYVTVVVFFDLASPDSARLWTQLRTLAEAHGRENLRIVWKYLPSASEPRATMRATAAEGVFARGGERAFESFVDAAFAAIDAPSDTAFAEWAHQAGVDDPRLAAGAFDPAWSAHVQADVALAAALGVARAPALFVNGTRVEGSLPYPDLAKAMAAEALKAKALEANGMPRDRLYAGRVALAFRPQLSFAAVDVTIGTGAEAHNGDTLSVHYVGRFIDGREFDSSRKRGRPFEFTLGNGLVIKGWDKGLVGMRVGGKRTLTVPPSLGYGARGMPPVIPPSATMIYEVELLGVK